MNCNNVFLSQEIGGLPVEMWYKSLAYTNNPQIPLVCSTFQQILADSLFILSNIETSLSERGVHWGSKSDEKKEDVVQRVKTAVLKRLPFKYFEKIKARFRDTVSITYSIFQKIFIVEEAFNLCLIFTRICDKFLPLANDFKLCFSDISDKGDIIEKMDKIRTTLTSNKANLETISELDLSFLELTLIPRELELFTGLKKITLSSNNIEAFPPGFGDGWSELEECNLDFNMVSELQQNFGKNWVKLKKISISNNALQLIKPGFGASWSNLEQIDLNFNKSLKDLPPKFGISWKELQKLGLNSTALVDFPKDLGSEWSKLQFLRIKKNKIEDQKIENFRSQFTNLIGLY